MSRVSRDQILNDLINNIYCRLKPSKMHGIGVFAIRDIPKGVDPFQTINEDTEEGIAFTVDEINKNTAIHPEVKKMVFDFYGATEGIVPFPAAGLNELTIAYCMNTSKTPNVATRDEGETFYTLGNIKAGEELLVDYDTFSDKI